MKVRSKYIPGPWMVDVDRPSGQLVVLSEPELGEEVAQVFGDIDGTAEATAYLFGEVA